MTSNFAMPLISSPDLMSTGKLAVVALAVGTFASTAQSQETYDLRGPVPEAGSSYTMTQQMDGTDGEMTVSTNGQDMNMNMATDGETVTRVEILEVVDGQVTHARTTIERNAQQSTVEFGGQEQTQTTGTETEGLVLDQQLNNGEWNTTTSGASLPREVLQNFENSGFVDMRLMYPENPVAIGESWEVDPSLLQGLAGQTGMGEIDFGGSVTYTLTGVEQRNGRQVAVIDVDTDMTMAFAIPGGQGEMEIEMDVEGKVYRDLAHYLDTQDLAGNMHMTMDVMGQAVVMDIDVQVQTQVEKN